MSAITANTTVIRTNIKKKTLIQVGIIVYKEWLEGGLFLLRIAYHL